VDILLRRRSLHTCISSGKPTTKMVEISSPFEALLVPFIMLMLTELVKPGGIGWPEFEPTEGR